MLFEFLDHFKERRNTETLVHCIIRSLYTFASDFMCYKRRHYLSLSLNMFIFTILRRLCCRDAYGCRKLWGVYSRAQHVCWKILVYDRQFTVICLLVFYVKWKLQRLNSMYEWDSTRNYCSREVLLCMQHL